MSEPKSEPKFVKVKLHLSGDIRTVAAGEADTLIAAKRASLYREKAVKEPAPEKAVK